MDLETLRILMAYLDFNTYPLNYSAEQRAKLRRQAIPYFLRDSVLYKRNKKNEEQPLRVISEKELDIILYSVHTSPSSGHFAAKKTIQRILERYYWPTIGKDVKAYIQKCDACQRRGAPKVNEPLHPIKVGQLFSRIGIDVVGPLNETTQGNKYIITATDYLTKWPEVRAVKQAKKEDIALFLWEEIICKHGCPKEILSDRGAIFVSKLIEQLFLILGIEHHLSSAYHPQANGLTERFNKTLCESLAKTASQYDKQWDLFVHASLFAYRTSQHAITQQSPFFLVYGRQPNLPVELQIGSYPERPATKETLQDDLIRRTSDLIGVTAEARITAKEKIKLLQDLQKL